MSTLPERIAALSPTKRALLARRVTAAGRVGNTAPLSFAQEGIWFLQQLDPDLPVFNMSVGVRLGGSLDEYALRWALDHISARHEILRTAFPSIQGQPLQVVCDPRPVPLPLIDMQAVMSTVSSAAIRHVTAEIGRRSFVLADGPPFAASLLRLRAREHVLILSVHHIAGDEWSLGIVIRELAALYEARCSGRSAELPPVELQYADHAYRQRAQSSALEEQLAACKQELANLQPLDLPIDTVDPGGPSFHGTSEPIAWPGELRDALSELARRQGVTLFTVLLAALQALLHRYSGQEEIPIGVAVTGRDRPELQNLVGLLANMIVIRGDVTGEPTFLELLERTRHHMVSAFARQSMPFQWLVHELRPDGDLTIDPLVQVAFHLTREDDAPTMKVAGLEVSPIDTGQEVSRFELAFGLRESARGFDGHVFYRTGLFSAATIKQLVDCWRTLLTAVVADPSQSLSSLAILNPALEQRFERGPDAIDERPLTLVHQQFAEHARQTPGATAITCAGVTIDYRGLKRRADAITRELVRRGVRADDGVAVLAPRGIEYVAAFLGILQAGAVYVPLDPDYPIDRLAYIAGNARPVITLASRSVPAAVAASAGTVVPLDAIDTDGDGPGDPGTVVRSDDAAYIIYTSGSTGQPKGVVVGCESLAHTMRGVDHAFRFTAADTVLCTASFSFDISMFEMLSPLLAGGRMLLLPERPLLTDAEWDAVLRQATFVHGTPSLLRQAVDAARRLAPIGAYPNVNKLMVGGDAVPPALVGAMADTFPDADVYIGYGPTETAMVCSLYRVQRDRRPQRHIIGRPMSNVVMRIVDRHQRMLPPGARGELLIGGPGVARGYLNAPKATAERFPTLDGIRFHRSGDLARYLPDGVIEFLGRCDTQVKVRGHRVDLAEVEAALNEHPDVKEAAVAVFDAASGEKALAAYVVTRSGAVSDDAIRAFLRSRLPAFMNPAALIALPALPLTATGKVDRRALPAPSLPSTDALYVAPRTAAEQTLTSVCAALLGLPRVGVDDSFFALGGDSILAIQLVARAREEGLRLTPRQLFEHRTIAELAAVVEPLAGAGSGVTSEGAGAGLPVMPGQAWVLEQEAEAERDHWNQAVVIETAAPVEGWRVQAAVAGVAARHEALRLRLTREEATWVQRVAAEAGATVTEVDVTAVAAGGRGAAVARGNGELQGSLSVTGGPVVRVAVWQGVTAGSVLAVVVHHVAVDGVSWRVLLDELERGCAGAGEAAPLRGLSWSGWVRAAQAGVTQVEEAATYWTETAARATRAAARWAGACGPVAQARTQTVVVSGASAQTLLRELPARYRVRVEESLLAALARAVTQVSGTSELGVMLEAHGRSGRWVVGDVSQTVGWFATRYPLWLPVPAGGMGAVVAAVKAQWQQVPHEGESYGMLRYLGAPPVREALAAAGTPALGFTYLGTLAATLNRPRFFQRSRLSPGPSRHPRSRLPDVLELTASWFDDGLRLAWTYAAGSIDEEIVAAVVAAYNDAIDRLIAWAQDPMTRVSPVEPVRETEYDEMDAALSELGERAEDAR